MLRSIVNKMKSAAHFLNYPILQYIPISMHSLLQKDNWHNPFSQATPQLLLFQNKAAFESALQHYQVQLSAPIPAQELYVICLNFKSGLVLFRYLTCKFVGTPQLGGIHIFAVTKKYFPPRAIHFALYTEDGRKLRSMTQKII
ncbi:MAG TPA: hypothetical protein VFC74_04125 [Oscillospiraceae bacterium]|nr:hypothetical protein [Oscillospiraceae bacterium]